MSKKLGLDAAYKGLNLTTSVNKNSVLNKINLSGSTGMKAYDSTKMLTNSIALGIKQPSKLTFGKKALSIGKKVLGKTPVGKAVGLAIAAGTGANIGYEYGKDKFKSFEALFTLVVKFKPLFIKGLLGVPSVSGPRLYDLVTAFKLLYAVSNPNFLPIFNSFVFYIHFFSCNFQSFI